MDSAIQKQAIQKFLILHLACSKPETKYDHLRDELSMVCLSFRIAARKGMKLNS
ncbi:unnamed protein product [Amoebophrya sp. A120]|nr:unnamed protein product [Amoebophrya sp. A120]|eukprot:GSA120T00016498001.1